MQDSDNMSKSNQIDGEADEDFDFAAAGTPDDEIPAWIQAHLDFMAGLEFHSFHSTLEWTENVQEQTASTHAVRATVATPNTHKRRQEGHRYDPYDPEVLYMWSDQAQMAYRQVGGKTEWASCILDTPGPNMMKVAVFDDGVEWECAGVLFHGKNAEASPKASTKKQTEGQDDSQGEAGQDLQEDNKGEAEKAKNKKKRKREQRRMEEQHNEGEVGKETKATARGSTEDQDN